MLSGNRRDVIRKRLLRVFHERTRSDDTQMPLVFGRPQKGYCCETIIPKYVYKNTGRVLNRFDRKPHDRDLSMQVYGLICTFRKVVVSPRRSQCRIYPVDGVITEGDVVSAYRAACRTTYPRRQSARKLETLLYVLVGSRDANL